ncbi:hypothetical protein B9479_001401 [Cryptococcus floricola]|uniref:Uncharacterized protein n=1 Tax=Cryptococcus floricola TaxID=2591691 RepID=A0A5D3B5G3_9TREE|nr:hypothetical protein B9479_001401 [Cryptococcus floricola]
MSSTPSPSGPSSFRSRRPAPLEAERRYYGPLSQSTVAGDEPSGNRDIEPTQTSGNDLPSTAVSGASGASATSSVFFPGGLPLPAVKGVITGIESPRHGRGSPSIGSRREIPVSPHSPTTTSTLTVRGQSVTDMETPQRPQPSAPVIPFRGDPTVKSTLAGLKMDGKNEICRLFGVA